MARMETDMPWFRELSAEDRSWVGLIVQAGIRGFVDWYRHERRPAAGRRRRWPPRSSAPRPRALAGVINLQQTVDLVRLSIEVVESNIDDILDPEDAPDVHAAVLRYAREVAFATAEVYARAAEVRGAWDARLEALVVDAVLRAEADEARALPRQRPGLGGPRRRRRRAGRRPGRSAPRPTSSTRYAAPRAPAGMDALCAVQGERLVVLLGGVADAAQGRRRRSSTCSATGPVVVGPVADDLSQRPRLRPRRAVGAPRRRPGWPEAPRPVRSSELLPERALAGDGHARRHLVEEVYLPLLQARGHADRDPGGVLPARLVDRGDRPRAVRAPQHRALPAAPGRRPHRAHPRPSRGTRSPSQIALVLGRQSGRGERARHRRSLCRNPTKNRAVSFVRAGGEAAAPRPGRVGAVLVIVAPGQGAQTPGFLTPWLEDPTFAARFDWLSTVAGLDLAHYGTEADADDDPRHQDRPAAAGRHRPGRGARAVPAPGRRVRRRSAPSPATASASSTAAAGARVITAEQAMVLVRERGKAMAEAAAVTADRDDRRPRRRPRGGARRASRSTGSPPPTTTAPARSSPPARSEQLAALAEDPPAKARLMPLSVAGAFHTDHMAPAVGHLASLARSVSAHDPRTR